MAKSKKKRSEKDVDPALNPDQTGLAATEDRTADDKEPDSDPAAPTETEAGSAEDASPEPSGEDGTSLTEIPDGETPAEAGDQTEPAETENQTEPAEAGDQTEPAEDAAESEDASDEPTEAEKEADLVYRVLGPQSVGAHLLQMLVATVPILGAPLIVLWVIFRGTPLSVALVSAPTAFCLALLAFWAFGGCANVNRRRFARAYFLWIIAVAALLALIALLAVSFGFDYSPVLKRIISPYIR